MNKNEMTLEEALSYVQTCRPIAMPNSAFLGQLERYEEVLTAARIQLERDSERYGAASYSSVSALPQAGPQLGPQLDSSLTHEAGLLKDCVHKCW
jgi:hypothetical protein